MKRIKPAAVPLGVLLIALFYAFGALVLLAYLIINPQPAAVAIATRHGLPASTGNWILPVIAGIGLVIAYGLLSLSRWGFYLTITYLLYFGFVNFYMADLKLVSAFFGDALWSLLVIVYLLIVRRRFFGEERAKSIPAQE